METSGTIRTPVKPRARRRDERPASSDLNVTTRDRTKTDDSVSIGFELSTNTMVTLAIFNDDGRLVDVLFEGWLWPGQHEVDCKLKGREPGRYKCLLDTPTVRLVRYIDVRLF